MSGGDCAGVRHSAWPQPDPSPGLQRLAEAMAVNRGRSIAAFGQLQRPHNPFWQLTISTEQLCKTSSKVRPDPSNIDLIDLQ